MTKAHAILHAPFEVPGVFQFWVVVRGYDYSGTHIYKGEELPSAEEPDLFLFMGGPQAPDQVDEYPYLKDEIALAAKVIAADKYVLGVCLGAQIIGKALGAPVEPIR